MLTKGAIGNLINRYKAVLKKCTLINVFGSLAVASMLVMGGASAASAADQDYDYEDLKEITTWADGKAVNVTNGGYRTSAVFRRLARGERERRQCGKHVPDSFLRNASG